MITNIEWQEIDRHVLDVFRMRYPEHLTPEKIATIMVLLVPVVWLSLGRLVEGDYVYEWVSGIFRLTDKGLKSGLSDGLEG